MAYGFIYFLTNPSMPGLTKIGMTCKHPRDRMEELTKATACPEPFELIAFFDVAEPRHAEADIHRELDEYRVNCSREFFRAPYRVLRDKARQWIDTAEGCCNMDALDRLVLIEMAEEFNAFIEETC